MPPSANDVILSLFGNAAALDVASPVYKFAAAAELGRNTKDVSECELKYSCSGSQFNRNIFGSSFGLKNRLRLRFESETCLNYPFLNIFLV